MQFIRKSEWGVRVLCVVLCARKLIAYALTYRKIGKRTWYFGISCVPRVR